MESGQGHSGPGWYVDPAGRSHARWWDGAGWTATIAIDGAGAPDPYGLDGVAPDAACVPIGAADPVPPRTDELSPRRRRRAAKRALRDARREHDRAVAVADRVLRDAERSRANDLLVARAQLAAAEDPRGRLVGVYRGVELYERVIVTPDGHEVTVRGATADVDAAGSLAVTHRPTFTRAAAGGLLFGPIGVLGSLAVRKREVHDGRELYLLIETEAGGLVVQCPGDDGLVARQFALAVGTVARDLDAHDAQRDAIARAARAAVARIEADTATTDAARVAAERARRDPQRLAVIAAAEHAVAALEAGPPVGPDDRGDSGPAPLP
jgi:hypothetical protein